MPYQFENATILVVDDMKAMLSLTASTLGIFGVKNVLTATNVDDAFQLFCQHAPDIVLTDWLMEPDDGMELIRRIRKDPRSPNRYVPIILMTGYSAKMRVMEARDRGITEFLAKPFSARDLYTRIEQLIEKPRKFVDSKEFFGPDRRRRKDNYSGPRRRRVDESKTPDPADYGSGSRIDSILKKLRDEVGNKDIKT